MLNGGGLKFKVKNIGQQKNKRKNKREFSYGM
jgi:hypothetical protein